MPPLTPESCRTAQLARFSDGLFRLILGRVPDLVYTYPGADGRVDPRFLCLRDWS